jgi:hypothetical protein
VHFFEYGHEGKYVTAVLFEPDYENNCFRYFSYHPKDSKPSISEEGFPLNAGVPGAALQRNDVVVVPDIAQDLASHNPVYYQPTDVGGNPVGSIVAMVLRDTERDSVPFVLTVRINEIGVFQEKDYLREVLDHFNQRILLEDRLRHLKDHAQ